MEALKLAVRSSDYLVAHLQLDAAASILERYLLYHPPHSAVLNRLGQIRLLQGRANEASLFLKQALMLRQGPEQAALAKANPLIAQAAVDPSTK